MRSRNLAGRRIEVRCGERCKPRQLGRAVWDASGPHFGCVAGSVVGMGAFGKVFRKYREPSFGEILKASVVSLSLLRR